MIMIRVQLLEDIIEDFLIAIQEFLQPAWSHVHGPRSRCSWCG
jgi:hypothetical protein